MRHWLWRNGRKVAKALWWIITPWHIRQRLRIQRQRDQIARRTRSAAAFFDRERLIVGRRLDGTMEVGSGEALDLYDDESLAAHTHLRREQFLWDRQAASAVHDRWSAIRFCIDLLRSNAELRGRFPGALLRGDDPARFAAWLASDEARSLGLAADSLKYLGAILREEVGARARQVFLANDSARTILPHGLTPAGWASLLVWFVEHQFDDQALRLEEVWWLLMEAAADPPRELTRAYLFSPDWQRQFPDALSVFGGREFCAWFAKAYGSNLSWLDVGPWIAAELPDRQIRAAYRTKATWQSLHPMALEDVAGAAALVEWLRSPAAELSAEAAAWCRSLDVSSTATALATPGLNVIGHFCYPSGLRVSVQSIVGGLRDAGVDLSLRDMRTDVNDDPHHVDYAGLEVHDTTLIHVQPEPFYAEVYRRADIHERNPKTYRIAYWYWEFDTIPDSWIAHSRGANEVWTATEFVAKGLRDKLSVPVRTMFPGGQLAPYERRDKSHFGLREESFTFLFTFHMVSVMERKNPLGLIRAFKQAFRPEEAVRLVLKTSFGDRHPAQIKELREAAAGANITIIDQVYSPDEVLSLMDACDAYVSLHRSEGLGLTMAEAMLMGKPVIATNFSGNVDFMDESNSLLVPYKLVKLGKPIPPYDADLEWAEPSEQHAAELMRRLYDDQAWAKEVGARGKASAEANLSLEAAGRRIAARLEEIKLLRRRSAD